MIKKEVKYSYNDLCIQASDHPVDIEHRAQINPFVKFTHTNVSEDFLPIFASPMDTVVNLENLEVWKQNHIIPIIPRNISIDDRLSYLLKGYWTAFSLREAELLFTDDSLELNPKQKLKICVDMANGHMDKMLNIVSTIKAIYPNKFLIMAGNAANPKIIQYYDASGVDYIRFAVGSGSACTTTPNTGIHYPIASLIEEAYNIKQKYDLQIKIVADGGVRNYDDVNKALALGADFVMIGGLFAGMYESAAKIQCSHNNYREDFDKIDYNHEHISEEQIRNILKENPNTYFKEFYGMSTKKAQMKINPGTDNLKTAEGKVTQIPCNYTIKQWVENMIHYLRSCMSYCGKFNISEFCGKETLLVKSPGTMQVVNK
jgi:hypothetical protein